MSADDTLPFTPYWLDEQDWLCIIEFLPRDDEEQRSYGAEAIGYLLGYAQMTDTRMLALLGDPEAQAYELLFSFRSPSQKEAFIALAQSNEITETDPDLMMVPVRSEIEDARPLAMVLDEDVLRHATSIAITLMTGSDSARPNRLPAYLAIISSGILCTSSNEVRSTGFSSSITESVTARAPS
jgi:hypothetical protein